VTQADIRRRSGQSRKFVKEKIDGGNLASPKFEQVLTWDRVASAADKP
jgi:hypothetical protein